MSDIVEMLCKMMSFATIVSRSEKGEILLRGRGRGSEENGRGEGSKPKAA